MTTTPTTTTETIACKTCPKEFQWMFTDDGLFSIDMLRPTQCPECCAIEEQRAEIARAAKAEADFMAAVDSNIPQRFRDTEINHPAFNRRAWDKLQSWQPTPEKPWIVLIGETGRCKTRIGYLLAKQILIDAYRANNRPVGSAFVTANEFTAAAQNQFNDSRVDPDFNRTVGAEAKAFLDYCRKIQFLFFDDLGKGRLTAAVAAALFDVLDSRYANNRATIITANSEPETIFANLDRDLAAPMAGRIYDASQVFQL